jgi:hypothetical protein
LLILLLAFAITGIHEADRGQERERQSALRLMPPPDSVQELAAVRKDLQRALSLLVECFGHPVDLKQVKSTAVTITVILYSISAIRRPISPPRPAGIPALPSP